MASPWKRFTRVPRVLPKSNANKTEEIKDLQLHKVPAIRKKDADRTKKDVSKSRDKNLSNVQAKAADPRGRTSKGPIEEKEILSQAALQMWEKQVVNWSLTQVSAWLSSIGQEQYIPMFKKEDINGSRMLQDDFSARYLESLGVEKDAAVHITSKLQAETFAQSISQHCPMLPREDISYPSSDSLHPTELGRGGFGVVLLGLYRGRKVAVKRLLNVADAGELRSLQNEINLLSSPQHKHKNLIRLIGICANPSGPMLVLEYMRRGDLGKLLRDRKCFEVDWIKRGRSIVAGIANGLCFLHTQAHPIVHRDLKPSNVLIDEAWVPKIADVGLARIRAGDAVEATRPVCSPPWAAPEILQNTKYTEKCDVFSFGVLLWQVVTRQIPWEGLSIDEIRSQVLGGERLDARSVPRSVFAVLRRCWLTSVHDRADMNTIIGLLKAIDETQNPDPEASTFRYEAMAGFEGKAKKVITNNLTINMGSDARQQTKAKMAEGEQENTLQVNVGGIGPARKDKERTGTGSVGENNGIILADGSVNINNNDGQVVQVNAPSAADQLLSLKNNVLQALKVEERDLDLRFLDEFCATYGPNVSAFQLDEIAQKFDDTTMVAELQRSLGVHASDRPVIARLIGVLKILVRLDGNALCFTTNRGLDSLVRYATPDTETIVLVELFGVLANLCGIPKCRSAIAKSSVIDYAVEIAIKHSSEIVRMRAVTFIFFLSKDEKRRSGIARQFETLTEEDATNFVRQSTAQDQVLTQFCGTLESLSSFKEVKAFLSHSRKVLTDLIQQKPDLAVYIRHLLSAV